MEKFFFERERNSVNINTMG